MNYHVLAVVIMVSLTVWACLGYWWGWKDGKRHELLRRAFDDGYRDQRENLSMDAEYSCDPEIQEAYENGYAESEE